MSSYFQSNKLKLISSLVAGGLIFAGIAGTAFAQEQPSAQKILQALTPKPVTRSLSAAPPDTAKAAQEQERMAQLPVQATIPCGQFPDPAVPVVQARRHPSFLPRPHQPARQMRLTGAARAKDCQDRWRRYCGGINRLRFGAPH